MGNLQDILEFAESIKIESHPVAIIVDTSMMHHICDRVPIGRGRLGLIDGIPVHVDDTIGLNRGIIRYSDGRIEKFGSWPKPDKSDV